MRFQVVVCPLPFRRFAGNIFWYEDNYLQLFVFYENVFFFFFFCRKHALSLNSISCEHKWQKCWQKIEHERCKYHNIHSHKTHNCDFTFTPNGLLNEKFFFWVLAGIYYSSCNSIFFDEKVLFFPFFMRPPQFMFLFLLRSIFISTKIHRIFLCGRLCDVDGYWKCMSSIWYRVMRRKKIKNHFWSHHDPS